MTTLHAQPYNPDASGFYFHNYDEYAEKSENLKDSFGQPVEEFEIQFIDGENPELFNAANINQSNLETYFDEIADLDEESATKIIYLLDTIGMDFDQAYSQYEDVQLQSCSAEDYAYDLINETTEIPESLTHYIDYKAIARDMIINGEIHEISRELIVTNCLDF